MFAIERMVEATEDRRPAFTCWYEKRWTDLYPALVCVRYMWLTCDLHRNSGSLSGVLSGQTGFNKTVSDTSLMSDVVPVSTKVM